MASFWLPQLSWFVTSLPSVVTLTHVKARILMLCLHVCLTSDWHRCFWIELSVSGRLPKQLTLNEMAPAVGGGNQACKPSSALKQ